MAFEYPGGAPVKSGDYTALSHLKWLDDVVYHLKTLDMFIRTIFAGMFNIPGDPQNFITFPPVASNLPDMNTGISVIFGFCNGVPFCKTDLSSWLYEFTAPAAKARIDIIAVDARTGDIDVFTGTESDTPTAPTGDLEDYHLAVAYVHHRVAETCITDTDNSTDGYIEVLVNVMPS